MLKKVNIGQVYLKDNFIINKFVDLIKPNKNDYFIEIGPGFGAITSKIINLIKKLILVELDFELYKFLLYKFSNYTNLIIIKSDARYINLNKIINVKKVKYRIFGSLPYYASISIILNLCKYIKNINDMHFIVQKELSDRLIYKLGNKKYSKLTLFIKIFFDTEILYKKINSNSFFPIPKVDSTIIRMIPNNNFLKFKKNQFKKFNDIINLSFKNRRKTIKNNLKKYYLFKNIKNLIDINKRPQDISFYEYFLLSKL